MKFVAFILIGWIFSPKESEFASPTLAAKPWVFKVVWIKIKGKDLIKIDYWNDFSDKEEKDGLDLIIRRRFKKLSS